jgi:hypothetical protein
MATMSLGVTAQSVDVLREDLGHEGARWRSITIYVDGIRLAQITSEHTRDGSEPSLRCTVHGAHDDAGPAPEMPSYGQAELRSAGGVA